MIDADLDRRLQRWMTDREPATVPAPVRQLARLVAEESPPPLTWRIQSIVRARPTTDAQRAIVLLVTLGLLLAALFAAMMGVGSHQPDFRPAVVQWREFIVGEPAPPVEFRAVGGALSDDDDATLEFEDLVGSLVVMYFPDPDSEPGIMDVGGLVETTLNAPGSNAFVVAAPHEWSRVLNADPGIVMAEPPADWVAARSEAGPAVLVVDRRGLVAAIFEGTLPSSAELAEAIDQAGSLR